MGTPCCMTGSRGFRFNLRSRVKPTHVVRFGAFPACRALITRMLLLNLARQPANLKSRLTQAKPPIVA